MGRLAKKRVLVVEDEILISMDIEHILTDSDFEVVGPARSLTDAMSLAAAEYFDIAVIDINLGSGEVIAPVVQMLKARGIPFVFTTGYTDCDQARDGPCVGKPFTKAALMEAVTNLLR